MQQHSGDAVEPGTLPGPDGLRTLEEMEKDAIQTTLTATAGNKSEALRRLGISRNTLHNKLRAYPIDEG